MPKPVSNQADDRCAECPARRVCTVDPRTCSEAREGTR